MPVDPKRVQALFLAAVEQTDPAGRAAVLDRECQTDAELRQRVEALLRASDAPGSLLESPAPVAAATVDEPVSERPGTLIGPYKLLQQIGEGGMGTVFMAEQTQPVQRKVALKVIKAGMDSRQVIARFEAERQALAMMDHVNIARVLDAGATENCRPYFVMELVHGVPITKYCDDNRLTPRERLELFVPVCQAIQHAHQKGIIHRDIKPSNVMITLYDGKPVPKVIDFGVAKATEQKLTERTLFTQYGTMVGTLEYMSPEQAEMSALGVDTRSDIYSLGVLLYELLTGSTPLSHKRMKEAAYAEILRMIKEEEPQKPSTRLSDSGEALASISANRHTEPAKLSKLMRGELDWIVMKTLEKDRNRRYETANGLAMDVQRYLADEAVQACPPSARYRFRKFARRNQVALLTAGLVCAALMLGTAISTWQAIRATRAYDAETKAHEAEATQRQRTQANLALSLKALDEIYVQVAEERLPRDPKRQQEDQELLKKALRFYEQFAKENNDDPTVEREVIHVYRRIGDIRQSLGQHVEAKQAYGRAIDRAEQFATRFPTEPENQFELAATHRHLGEMLTHDGNRIEAAEHLSRAIELAERLVADHPSITRYRAILAGGQLNLAKMHHDLGTDLEKAALAEEFRKVIDEAARVVADCPEPKYRLLLVDSHACLGKVLGEQGEPVEGDKQLSRAIELATQLVAEYPPVDRHSFALAIFYWHRGELPTRAGDPADYRRSIELLLPLVVKYSSVAEYRGYLAHVHFLLGDMLVKKGEPAAVEQYRQAIQLATRLVDECPSVSWYWRTLADSHRNLATVLSQSGDRDKAAEQRRLAQANYEELVAKSPNVIDFRLELASSLAAIGRNREAKEVHDQCLAREPQNARVNNAAAWFLVTCPDTQFRVAGRAVELAKKAVELAPQDGSSWNTLGVAHYRAGDWKAAIAALEKSMQLSKGGDSGDWLFLAMAHWQLGEKEQARQWYERAVPSMEKDKHSLSDIADEEEFRRFRAEAATLMGLKEPPTPKGKETPPKKT